MAKKSKSGRSKTGITPQQFDKLAKAFGTARMSKLSGYGGRYGTSTGTAKDAESLYNGMVGYAREYGTPDQLKAIEKMNPAKLRNMYLHGMLRIEDYFDYDEDGCVSLDKARQAIDRVIRYYNTLNQRANEMDRERRAGRNAGTQMVLV